MTDEELLEETLQTIMFSLRDMALEDIKRASEGGAKMGAFILASCLIDYLAGFFKGGKDNTTGEDYKAFVREYLPQYDPEKLRKDMRNKLVHNYSEGGSYWFTDANPRSHLAVAIDGRTFINLENLISELEAVLNTLYKDWYKNPGLAQRAINRFQNIGLLRPIQLPMPK